MAAAKKDFSKVKTNRMYEQLNEAAAETEQLPGQLELNQDGSITEAKQTKKQAKKTGSQKAAAKKAAAADKNEAAARINLAVTPGNYDYIKTMGALRGENMTEFINSVIREHQEANQEIYNNAKALLNKL